MALQAIAYASQAVKGLGSLSVDGLVERAAAFNKLAGVTGILLFDGWRFLQYIEGPEDGMATVYSRILNATSHSDIIELARGRVGDRRMPYWAMHWVPADKYQFNEAAFADWTSFSLHARKNPTLPTGVDRLTALAVPHLA